MKKTSSKYSFAIIFFVLGIFFVFVNWFLFNYTNSYMPNILFLGIILSFQGLGFLLVPGPPIEKKQEVKIILINMIKKTSWLEKSIWFSFLLAGIATNFWIFNYFHLKIG